MFTTKFWFQINPELSYFFTNVLFVLALSFLLVAFYANFKRKEKTVRRKAWQQTMLLGLTNTVVFLLWWIFALEAIPLLSARVWFLLIGLLNIVWMFRIKNKFRVIPISPEIEKKKVNKKYIP
jgi:uncharacterized membrane protein